MAETRDRLITATAELFRRHGYNGTGLKQITTAADAPTGSLYHHFPGGKDELTAVVLATSGAAYRELLEAIWDAAPDAHQALGDFFDGAAEVLEATDFIDPCPIGTVAREVASTNEPLRAASGAVFESWFDAARVRLLAAGLSEVAAEEFAITLVSAIEGGFLLARTSRSTKALRATGRHMQTMLAALLMVAAAERPSLSQPSTE